ncbi:hypothetical protein BKG76_00215 [Mycobacteroides franklinii]|uniref:DUF4333 domain-containing protein n=1 Tax=Mycobacteroides franklinii TaxID=948102 RepID=A0A1S1LGN1_9MYCO|nr:DUF4333 domain-containing protein [Mycobacteroides franklinii]OHU31727.1 hypothetical protein BKG76_00215 [Mycobacteroides franklinii]
MISAALLSMAALTSCHVSFNVGTAKDLAISKEKLASGVSDALTAQTGTAPSTSKCDGPLRGEKGATQRCWISDSQSQLYAVTVTVTTVEGEHIKFDIAVDDKPTSRPA